MNEEQLRREAHNFCSDLETKLHLSISRFEPGWRYEHLRVAINKIVENPDIPVDAVLKAIKRSYLCKETFPGELLQKYKDDLQDRINEAGEFLES